MISTSDGHSLCIKKYPKNELIKSKIAVILAVMQKTRIRESFFNFKYSYSPPPIAPYIASRT